MEATDFEVSLKVVVVGNGSVGKSSMIRRFCKQEYNENYKKTIGVDYMEKLVFVEKQSVRLMLWDCAGQEEFDSITRDYYKDAQAIVLAFSGSDRSSFDMIKGWKAKLEAVLSIGDVHMVLVQTKCDLPASSMAVTDKEAETLAPEFGIRFYRISVKQNVYVDDVFNYLAAQALKSPIPSCRRVQTHANSVVIDLFKKDVACVPTKITSTAQSPGSVTFLPEPIIESGTERRSNAKCNLS